MNFSSHYLWEKGQDSLYHPASLVLQQVSVHKRESLFTCVCEGGSEGEAAVRESGYFTERLVEWFHQIYLERYAWKDGEGEIREALQKELSAVIKELEDYGRKKGHPLQVSFWGMLFKENRFWMFRYGGCRGFLLNKRFNAKNMRGLEEVGTTAQVIEGKLQRHLGILVCTESFCNNTSAEELLEVFSVDKMVEDGWIEKRLKEFWRRGTENGNRDSVGAIYIRTS